MIVAREHLRTREKKHESADDCSVMTERAESSLVAVILAGDLLAPDFGTPPHIRH
jgi:hypothetical protein